MTNFYPPQAPPPPPMYTPPPPPPVRSSKKVMVGLVSCGALFALVVLVAALGSPKNAAVGEGGAAPTTTEAPTTTAAPTTTTAPGLRSDAPAPVGTEISPAKGWAVTVTGPALLDADAEMAAGNMFNRPNAGNQFVAVPISVTNHSGRPGTYSLNLSLKLLPPTGLAIDRSFVAGVPGVMDYTASSAQLQPEATLSGRLVFEVPTALVNDTVMLAEPLMTLDEIEDQRFLAIQ